MVNNYYQYIVRIKIGIPHSIIKSGINVVLSDLDAIWIKNPLPEHIINAPSEFDIIASGGRKEVTHSDLFQKIPSAPGIKPGYNRVLCGGWYFVRSTPASISFFDTVINDFYDKDNKSISYSDQKTINKAFYHKSPLKIASGPYDAADYEAGDLKVRVLGQSVVMRKRYHRNMSSATKMLFKKTYIAHIMSIRRRFFYTQKSQTFNLIYDLPESTDYLYWKTRIWFHKKYLEYRYKVLKKRNLLAR